MPKIRCPNCGVTIDLESRRDVDLNTIVNGLEDHPRRFTELLRLTGLPRKTFSARLKWLCDKGIVARDNGTYRLNGDPTLFKNEYIRSGGINMRKIYLGLRKNALVMMMLFAITSPFTFPVIVDALGLTVPSQTSPKQSNRTIPAEPLALRASFFIREEPPYLANYSSTLTFDASFSCGNITEYNWDLGDENNAQDCVVTHTYSEPGSYYVTLTVFDSEGKQTSVQKIVPIQPQPKTKLSLEADGGNAINVVISDVECLYAWQIEIIFDPAKAQIAAVTEGSFLMSQAGKFGTFPFSTEIDNEQGLINFAVTMLGEPLSGASGNGVLATITLVSGTYEEGAFQVSSLTLLESNGKSIPCIL